MKRNLSLIRGGGKLGILKVIRNSYITSYVLYSLKHISTLCSCQKHIATYLYA